jgi:ABC-2 type transport system ATP-binding protein
MNAKNAERAPALEMSQLGVRYGSRQVLHEVSFNVMPGQIYALLGRNGEGKTSMVRCALGWQRASSGSARLFGKEAWSERASLMNEVGVVEEHPSFPAQWRISEVLGYIKALRPRWDAKATSHRLEQGSIGSNTKVDALSRGQKAHLAMALALAHSPKLLILDDPTLGLDAVARRRFFETLVAEVAGEGISMLITTHDLAGIEGVADHVGMLAEGRLKINEPLEDLKARMRRLRWPKGQGSPALEGLDPLRVTEGPFGGEAIVARYSEAAFEALQKQAAGPFECEPVALEDAFIAWVDGTQEVRA